jgi:hypothetical protein
MLTLLTLTGLFLAARAIAAALAALRDLPRSNEDWLHD